MPLEEAPLLSARASWVGMAATAAEAVVAAVGAAAASVGPPVERPRGFPARPSRRWAVVAAAAVLAQARESPKHSPPLVLSTVSGGSGASGGGWGGAQAATTSTLAGWGAVGLRGGSPAVAAAPRWSTLPAGFSGWWLAATIPAG